MSGLIENFRGFKSVPGVSGMYQEGFSDVSGVFRGVPRDFRDESRSGFLKGFRGVKDRFRSITGGLRGVSELLKSIQIFGAFNGVSSGLMDVRGVFQKGFRGVQEGGGIQKRFYSFKGF